MKKTLIFFGVLICVTANAAIDLPLKRVVLFDSGVGYFEREAEVIGESSTQLNFTVEQLNDVIKSLIFLDNGGGTVSAVTYDARDPLTRTLQSFRVDLSDNPDRPTFFNRLRGVPVRLKTTGQDFEGRVLGVEKRVRVIEEEKIEEWFLNISAADGIRSFGLHDVQRVEILDSKIKADLEEALKIMAQSLDDQRKSLALNLSGEGKRSVRVGYLLEAPVWKTSYRLNLEDDKILLQGWAHVENVTEEDWKNVKLTLVSGRPLSFIQNLYDPIYVQRPVVEMETYGSIVPPVYDVGFAGEADMDAVGRKSESVAKRARAAGIAPAPLEGRVDMAEMSMPSLAETKEAGELFEYQIKEAMTLPRQKSAMAPIVNELVKGQTLSIYNQGVNAKFPLNGLELENSTTLHLKQGPVTVIEEGVYAGDARLPDLVAGEKRYLSYSLDLGREVIVERKAEPEEIVSIKIIKGTLWAERKHVDETLYKIKNKKQKDRPLMVEHRVRGGWDLVEPARADEKTADVYRFNMKLDSGKSSEFRVREQRVDRQSVVLSNTDDQGILFYMNQRVVSAGTRDALKRMVDMKMALGALRTEIAQLEKDYAQIEREQQRIRSNMHEVAKNSESYSMWERKLTQQETEIESIHEKLEHLRKTESLKRNELENYLGNLTIE